MHFALLFFFTTTTKSPRFLRRLKSRLLQYKHLTEGVGSHSYVTSRTLLRSRFRTLPEDCNEQDDHTRFLLLSLIFIECSSRRVFSNLQGLHRFALLRPNPFSQPPSQVYKSPSLPSKLMLRALKPSAFALVTKLHRIVYSCRILRGC